jgi:thymidylate synthase (FAD)
LKVELIQNMGDDLVVVNAARVSFDKESEWDSHGESWLNQSDTKLIKYLARHGHWTPFSHCVITLRETVPIFVARQRFKHMVGFTYNEVSRRYVDDTPEFFYPDIWRSRPDGSVKQGSGEGVVEWLDHDEHEVWDEPQSPLISTSIKEEYEHFIGYVKYLYELMIKNDVAPEQARMVLPQSMYTSYYVTGSLYAFARAYKLRADAHAQKEIRDLAAMWDSIIRPLYPVSWEALVS